MLRSLARLWLALWAILNVAPLQSRAVVEASDAPVLSTREGTAVASRAPATPRVSQWQDHSSGDGSSALPSAAHTGIRSTVAHATNALPAEAPHVRSAVLPDNYPTGPPELS